MATTANDAAIAESFWERMALGLALLILFGFAQFALRGFVDPLDVPLTTHLHGLAMLAWLGLLVVQPRLVRQGDIAMHRRLGRIGVVLSFLVVGLGLYVGLSAIAAGRLAPFFTPHYFLVLVTVELLGFGGLVWAAVAYRRQTDWHRHFMLGSAIMILEPALGRLLPMPLMVGWWDLPVAIIQLGGRGADRAARPAYHRARPQRDQDRRAACHPGPAHHLCCADDVPGRSAGRTAFRG